MTAAAPSLADGAFRCLACPSPNLVAVSARGRQVRVGHGVVRWLEGDLLERECSVPAREDREQSSEAKQEGEHDRG